MDTEMMMIHLEQDLYELVEEYEAAASNERLWAKGASDSETAQMHEENAERSFVMAQMYRKMAEHASDLFIKYVEGDE